MMDFSRSKFDFVGRAWLWYTISLVFIGLGLLGVVRNLITDGTPLIKGIDFTGGSIIKVQFTDWDQNRDTAKFSEEIAGFVSTLTDKAPQVLTTLLTPEKNGRETYGLLVQIRADASLIDEASADSRIQLDNKLRELGGDFIPIEQSEVGALMGKELTNKAIQGVAIGLVLILIYITFRLSFDFAVCAVIALAHDVLVLIGFFALFRLEINSSFVAIILTVVGYSINDTIIIYDRIRENMKVKRHLPFDVLVNTSLLETMARSINTTGTTVLAILALLIFGGESLKVFMIGMAVGITTGAYSSIFNASMLLVNWRLRGKKKRAVALASAEAAAIGIVTGDDDDLIDLRDDDEDEESAREAVQPITVDRAPSKSVAKSSKPKRRKRRQ